MQIDGGINRTPAIHDGVGYMHHRDTTQEFFSSLTIIDLSFDWRESDGIGYRYPESEMMSSSVRKELVGIRQSFLFSNQFSLLF